MQPATRATASNTMSKTYIVGRGIDAAIRIPREHDAVGKKHLEIEDTGRGRVRITDLRSTNGTFLRAGGKWVELKNTQTVDLDAELMLGDYKTTPRKLLETKSPAPK